MASLIVVPKSAFRLIKGELEVSCGSRRQW